MGESVEPIVRLSGGDRRPPIHTHGTESSGCPTECSPRRAWRVPRWSHSGFGFAERNIRQMRLFYLEWSNPQIISADSASPSISQTLSAKSGSWPLLPLPWSHYVRLLTVADPKARTYYEREALQGSWSVRQLDRQIASLAYQRTGSARSVPAKDEILPADAHVRDPFVLANQVLAREYHLNLPGEAQVAARIETVRRLLLRSPARLASLPTT